MMNAHQTAEAKDAVGDFGGLGRRVGDVWLTPSGHVVAPNYGRHGNEAAALEDLMHRLAEALDPQMIWLFGSRARGDERQDSDFDLCVVAKPDGCFDDDDFEKVYAPISGSGIGADVVPATLDVFRASLGLNTSFIWRIVHEGRLVYGTMPE